MRLFTIITLLFSTVLIAQKTPPTQKLDSGTIENQFDYVIKNSNRYQEYKVIKRAWIDRLKIVVNDSLDVLKVDLSETRSMVTAKDTEINGLKNTLDERNSTIEQLNKEKDGILLFGFIISKPVYNTILWSTIGVLLTLLLIYIFRFNRSHVITKETKEKLDELEQEYEAHRTRALEREQQIRRKLQDEINKQKKDK
ncbi:tRNA (guanine-N1)-methyltransferase [Urechidicola vernalis]|uniref:tRNA (Guanine-N1)-methyltransferase n=1 Tax=Urechidicola vernalis TaxID=3075600 RepID=A0ABU2Y6S1_9FLAO|nr:tRNA (guanine-N1)-methyltransferase [Urechidicola sp. P050]MDT0553895.1 tRNA (guanine-N1)-methyltransferase [Urechidicola sp. P050]